MSNYSERQRQWITKYNIQVGDKVKVVRKCGSYANGWDLLWNDSMDDWVGKTITIKEIHEQKGFKTSYDKSLSNWWFPYFVLEPIKINKGNKKVKESLDNLRGLL